MSHYQDDVAVIRRIKNKEKDALYLLYDKYSAALFGIILRICRNRALAEDLLQETFIKIWENIEGYDSSKGRFYTWAYRIAKNTTLNTLRKSDMLIQTEDLGVVKDKSTTTTEVDLNRLNGAIKKLEPHHQEALSLVYFRGYTHREANEEMGVPLGTFKSYIRQAVQLLRESYKSDLLLIWWLFEIVV